MIRLQGTKLLNLVEVEANEIEDEVAAQLEKFENEIIPVKLASYKPLDIEEALESFKIR